MLEFNLENEIKILKNIDIGGRRSGYHGQADPKTDLPNGVGLLVNQYGMI